MFNRQKKINRKGCTAAPPLAVVARKENGTLKEVERKKKRSNRNDLARNLERILFVESMDRHGSCFLFFFFKNDLTKFYGNDRKGGNSIRKLWCVFLST